MDRDHTWDPDGRSEAVRRLRVLSRTIARHRYPVLIAGELGVGKLRFARLLHELSGRPQQPFHRVDCALSELTAESLQSELANIELGHGGTVVFEHIEEASHGVQRLLIRILSGSSHSRTGCRILATTRRDLAVEVLEGRCLSDLYFRLRAMTVEIPPLRERREDLPMLSMALLAEIGRSLGAEPPEMTAEALDAARSYPWPGNVRQLHSELTRAAGRGVRTIGRQLLEEGLDDRIPIVSLQDRAGVAADFRARIEAFERTVLAEALGITHGNRKHAAALLGITRRTLQRKLAAARLEGHPMAETRRRSERRSAGPSREVASNALHGSRTTRENGVVAIGVEERVGGKGKQGRPIEPRDPRTGFLRDQGGSCEIPDLAAVLQGNGEGAAGSGQYL